MTISQISWTHPVVFVQVSLRREDARMVVAYVAPHENTMDLIVSTNRRSRLRIFASEVISVSLNKYFSTISLKVSRMGNAV